MNELEELPKSKSETSGEQEESQGWASKERWKSKLRATEMQ
jgi:hypothetical protein